MSANPNHLRSEAARSMALLTRAFSEAACEEGRNGLQALLAFASIHQQATRRRSLNPQVDKATPQEEFALNDVLEVVAARALTVTGADGIAIAVAEENQIVCRACTGNIALDVGVRLDPTSGFSGACLRSGHTVRCDDSETDSRVDPSAARALGARSMVAVPLTANQRVVGLIAAFSRETYGFNASDLRSLNLLSDLIVAAIGPEEEDRLAEVAGHIRSLAIHGRSAAGTDFGAPSSRYTPPITVDEKFRPAAARPEAIKPAAALVPTHASLPSFEPKLDLGGATLGPSHIRLSILGIVLITVFVLAAVTALSVWQKIPHAKQTISVPTRTMAETSTSDKESRAIPLPGSAEEKPDGHRQVMGIRHWSSQDSSTVVVDLEDQVQYEAHSLVNPARVYFDLFDTKLTPELLNQSIDVNDGLLKRLRMAQPGGGVTRIVLDLRKETEFSVRLDPDPYRLTVEVRAPNTDKTTVTAATLSNSSPAVSPQPTEPRPTTQSQPPIQNSTPGEKPALAHGFLVVLDAGHGGWDLGTLGRKGLVEKDVVLDVVERLGKLLENKLGVDVLYTRQGDSYMPLEKRAEIANLAGANIFLSVHANYSDLPSARGVETYYTNTYSSLNARTTDFIPSSQTMNWTGVDIRAKVTDSHRLADDVQEALYAGLSATTRKIRNRGVKKAQYVVLTGTQMPSVLAEISFVSSPDDENRLQSSEHRRHIAEALCQGVAKFYNETRQHTNLASNQPSQ